MEFKFAMGDWVKLRGSKSGGQVIERLYHEFSGASRIKYIITGRIFIGDERVGGEVQQDVFEHEIEPGEPIPAWHVSQWKQPPAAPLVE